MKESAGLNLGVRVYLQGTSGSWNALRGVMHPPGERDNARMMQVGLSPCYKFTNLPQPQMPSVKPRSDGPLPWG